MKGRFPIDRFRDIPTPFYYYDAALLRQTLQTIRTEAGRYPNFVVHYAVKANANPKLLAIIRENGLGADCVSGGEIATALAAGFPPESIVFAGVGKADWEIDLALKEQIYCFNVESLPELEVIDQRAGDAGVKAGVALRVNPNVGAHTHANITTGLAENKFGINMEFLDEFIYLIPNLKHIEFIGLHFHIGSQILDLNDFAALCNRINELLSYFEGKHMEVSYLNVGGGLGVDYMHPNRQPVPNFKEYFNVYATHLKVRPGQKVHFELGRSVVAQCGSLVSRVLYVKQGIHKQFAILDAGMSELVRPALYQAYHKIENLTSDALMETYDVVGPVCESSDVFGKAIDLNKVSRGDIIAIRSAGAYGETMASCYNCRPLPQSVVG